MLSNLHLMVLLKLLQLKLISLAMIVLVLYMEIIFSMVVILQANLKRQHEDGKATLLGYWVSDPERYGVTEFDVEDNCLSFEEKPKEPKSNYAVVGLYSYPQKGVVVAKNIKPFARGE